ncbi:MAG: hypothetical protein ACRCTI_05795 [Beijerinckiaceae bacterium]
MNRLMKTSTIAGVAMATLGVVTSASAQSPIFSGSVADVLTAASNSSSNSSDSSSSNSSSNSSSSSSSNSSSNSGSNSSSNSSNNSSRGGFSMRGGRNTGRASQARTAQAVYGDHALGFYGANTGGRRR